MDAMVGRRETGMRAASGSENDGPPSDEVNPMDSRATHVATGHAAEPLTETSLGELRDAFRGVLLRPEDDGYEHARQVWNAMVDRRPALIARCSGAADVAAAVRFARRTGLEIAVRGGGHSVAGHGVTEGGLLIDLSPMNGVRVDPDAGRAWVAGGAQLGQLDHEARLHGLATTAGMISHTGVGGLTLGGGYGYLARQFGLACDNLASVQVVTADGAVLTASETQNADLFWGVRGGGGNFGVVTAFEFRMHEVDAMVATGDLMFHLDDGAAALRGLFAFHAAMPDRMLTSAAITTVRAEWGLPSVPAGQEVVAISWVYLGDQVEGRRVADPLHRLAKPLFESEESIDYLRLQRFSDVAQRHGMRRYWKGAFAWEMPDSGLEAMLARRADRADPDPGWSGTMVSLGGAVARIAEDDTAFSGRTARFDFLVTASWEDPREDAARLAGSRAYFERVAPFLPGPAYINSLEPDDAARVRAAYGAAKHDRLIALKRRYDPDNVFHLNHNIRP